MMLKDHPAATPAAKPLIRPAEPPVTETGGPATAHADYDLQPLRVRSLEHYLERPDNERFHVR